jgi:hypothetical protein
MIRHENRCPFCPFKTYKLTPFRHHVAAHNKDQVHNHFVLSDLIANLRQITPSDANTVDPPETA